MNKIWSCNAYFPRDWMETIPVDRIDKTHIVICGAVPCGVLTRPDHQNFTSIEGFKGRGLILEFEWSGTECDLPESMLYFNKPDVLCHIFHHIEPNPDGTFKGIEETYWHSRLFQGTTVNLNLIDAMARGEVLEGADYSQITENWEITDAQLQEAKNLIGQGLSISVIGGEPPPSAPGPQALARIEQKRTCCILSDLRRVCQRGLRRLWRHPKHE